MGQKIHPGGLRVGVIHDWKSNWYTSAQGLHGRPARGHQDPRAHPRQARARGPVRHPDPQGQAADHDRHLHGPPRDRDRQVGRRGRRAAPRRARDDAKNVHININEIKRPELDAKLVAQSIAEQLQNRVSFRRAMKRSLASAMRSGAHGVKINCGGRLGGGEMCRVGELLRGPRPAAHDPRRHRLRLRRGEDDLRPDRRQGLDQQGRDHAGGLRGLHAARTRGSATRIRLAARGGASRGPGAARESGARPPGRPRGPRPGARGDAAPAAAGPAGVARGGGRRRGGGGGGGGVRATAAPRAPASRAGGAAASADAAGRDARDAGRRRSRQPRPDAETPIAETPETPPRTEAPETPSATTGGETTDAAPEEDQVPQAATRPPGGTPRARRRAFRRLRAQGSRGRLDHQPPDRGRPDRDDAQDQARRQGLDQRLPRQAGDAEAGRDAHGLRQGLSRALGGRGQAGPRHVRARRRPRAARQGGAPAGRPKLRSRRSS